MDVDEARSDGQPAGVDLFPAALSNTGSNRRNTVTGNSHIHLPAFSAGPIENSSAANDEVVIGADVRPCGYGECCQCCSAGDDKGPPCLFIASPVIACQ